MTSLPSSTPKHIALCTPCDDHVATPYFTSVAQMLMYTWNNAPPDLAGMSLHNYGSSILPFSRNVIAASALEAGATHLLWIDSDMDFAPDTALRLLSHDLDIVGSNCAARRPPYRNTARIGADEIQTTLDSTGIEKVERLGFGVVLVRADVFRTLAMPWFAFEWIPEKSVFRGEDFYFFQQAAAAGFEVYVDHDVSKGVRHMGTFGYSPVLKGMMADLDPEQADGAAPQKSVGGAT